MRFSGIATIAGGLVLSITPFIKADAFDPKAVPADAKWMVHVDADLLQKSKIWDAIDKRLQKNEGFITGIKQIETVTGAQFPKSLHDVTIYGREAGEEAAVIMIHSDADTDQLVNIVRQSPTYSSSTYNDHEIHAWQDKGKQLYGFTTKGLIIIGHTERNIESELDVLDGKGDALPADSIARGGAKAGVVAYVSGTDIAAIKKDRNPVIDQIDAGWISLSEEGTNLMVHSNLVAKDAKSATKIRSMLEGLKAFVTMASTEDTADNKVKNAATALENLTATAKDNTVAIDGAVPENLISAVIEQGVEAPQSVPTTSPAPK